MDYQQARAAIDKFLQQTSPPASQFNEVALLLFRYQYLHNDGYRALCDTLGLPPQSIKTWQQIPAVTTDCFKLKLPPSCLQADDISTTFLTSGTTAESRGHHHFRDTSLYEHSILIAWKQLELPPLQQTLILTPPPQQTPHSSLSHMMETLKKQWKPSAQFLINHDQIDHKLLQQAVSQQQPITLLGTALAFLNLFEQLPQPLNLPVGSWAMETGGYKGSGRSLSKEDLYKQFEQTLALPSEQIWNEYSMTELSSQFYSRGLAAPHRSPHWVKIKVLHPDTDQPVEAGQIGYLVIYDLANIDSVLALRTQDLAIYHDEHTFTLIGRDPSAIPRGCSRSIDESLNS